MAGGSGFAARPSAPLGARLGGGLWGPSGSPGIRAAETHGGVYAYTMCDEDLGGNHACYPLQCACCPKRVICSGVPLDVNVRLIRHCCEPGHSEIAEDFLLEWGAWPEVSCDIDCECD